LNIQWNPRAEKSTLLFKPLMQITPRRFIAAFL
jgi:hypothetical protein